MQNKPAYLDLPDMTNEAAAFAAKWWADTVRKGVFGSTGDAMMNVFGGYVLSKIREDITPEAIAEFEKTLLAEMLNPTKLNEREIGEYAPKPGQISYGRARQSVDYHPSGVLADALARLEALPEGTDDAMKQAWSKCVRAIGNCLPFKTDVTINPVSVCTRLGYDATFGDEWRAYDIVDPGEWNIHNRLYSERYSYRWSHDNHVNNEKLIYVTLDKDAVIPTIALYKLDGIVLADFYGGDLEDPLRMAGRIAYAFSSAVPSGYGYLALGRRR